MKHANCAVIDTDGLRPPYVHLDDDHQGETALEGLDATTNAYVVGIGFSSHLHFHGFLSSAFVTFACCRIQSRATPILNRYCSIVPLFLPHRLNQAFCLLLLRTSLEAGVFLFLLRL